MDFSDSCRFCLEFVEINERNYLNLTVKKQFEYLTNAQVGSFCNWVESGEKFDNFWNSSWSAWLDPIFAAILVWTAWTKHTKSKRNSLRARKSWSRMTSHSLMFWSRMKNQIQIMTQLSKMWLIFSRISRKMRSRFLRKPRKRNLLKKWRADRTSKLTDNVKFHSYFSILSGFHVTFVVCSLPRKT